MASKWYYAQNGEQKGPVSTDALRDMITIGQLSLTDLVWKTGLAEWVKVSQVREFVEAAHTARNTQPVPSVMQVGPEPEELRLVEPDEKPKAGILRPQQEVLQHVQPQAKPQKQTISPASGGSASKSQVAAWHFSRNGQQQGPFTAQTLKEMALSGEIQPTDHLWKNGLKDWVEARSLPGLKFSASSSTGSGTQSTQIATEVVSMSGLANANTIVTDAPFDSFGADTSDANSIFDIMSDPAFVNAPISTPQTPNTALMSAVTLNSKPQSRGRIEFESPPSELAFLPIAFIGSFLLACIAAYGYGYLRYYIPLFIIWYFVIFLIGSLLSVMVCSCLAKARFDNTVVTVGYLLLLGGVVLYIAWATTITLAINDLPEEYEPTNVLQVLASPMNVFQNALNISIHTETTSRRHGTGSAFLYFLLEAVFITVAPVYTAYKRYNESN